MILPYQTKRFRKVACNNTDSVHCRKDGTSICIMGPTRITPDPKINETNGVNLGQASDNQKVTTCLGRGHA